MFLLMCLFYCKPHFYQLNFEMQEGWRAWPRTLRPPGPASDKRSLEGKAL